MALRSSLLQVCLGGSLLNSCKRNSSHILLFRFDSSEPPRRGQKFCAARKVSNILLSMFCGVCPARISSKNNKSVLTLFDDFWPILKWPLSASPICGSQSCLFFGIFASTRTSASLKAERRVFNSDSACRPCLRGSDIAATFGRPRRQNSLNPIQKHQATPHLDKKWYLTGEMFCRHVNKFKSSKAL